MKVYQKLIQVQSTLKSPKNQRNNFGNYNYRNCEDILEALKPILVEAKATVMLTDDIVMVGDRHYVKATARFIDTETGDVVENVAFAREEVCKPKMDTSQTTGSASSYARKYALNGMFLIDDTKDSDHDSQHPEYQNQNKSNSSKGKSNGTSTNTKSATNAGIQTITEAQAKRLFALSKGQVNIVKEICIRYGYNSSKDILTKDYDLIAIEIEDAVKTGGK